MLFYDVVLFQNNARSSSHQVYFYLQIFMQPVYTYLQRHGDLGVHAFLDSAIIAQPSLAPAPSMQVLSCI